MEVSLSEADAAVEDEAELIGCFDAFGDGDDAVLSGGFGEVGDQFGFEGAGGGVADEFAIEFDVIGSKASE